MLSLRQNGCRRAAPGRANSALKRLWTEPEIDIWRVATLMLKRYGDNAEVESAVRAHELTAARDHDGAAVWCRPRTPSRSSRTNTPGPVH